MVFPENPWFFPENQGVLDGFRWFRTRADTGPRCGQATYSKPKLVTGYCRRSGNRATAIRNIRNVNVNIYNWVDHLIFRKKRKKKKQVLIKFSHICHHILKVTTGIKKHTLEHSRGGFSTQQMIQKNDTEMAGPCSACPLTGGLSLDKFISSSMDWRCRRKTVGRKYDCYMSLVRQFRCFKV